MAKSFVTKLLTTFWIERKRKDRIQIPPEVQYLPEEFIEILLESMSLKKRSANWIEVKSVKGETKVPCFSTVSSPSDATRKEKDDFTYL